MNVKDITKKVFEVRRSFEEKSLDEKELAQLYYEYNAIEDVDCFISKARELFPHLNCGIASVYLQKLFPKSEIIIGKYKKNNHTFLLLEDAIVVDITADQYGGPTVYVGRLLKPWEK